VGFSNVRGIPGLPAVSREARILDGRIPAREASQRVAADVADRLAAGEPAPMLATIVVGDAAASRSCVAAVAQACEETGVSLSTHRFEAETPEDSLTACIRSLNDDPAVSGILLMLPLPSSLAARPLLEQIDPRKDVDGLTLDNATRFAQGMRAPAPATAKGILALVDHYGIELAGRPAVVVGRSELVGRPVATLLTQRDSTVTVCHSRSRDLEGECRRADVLIAAAGRAHLINDAHVRQGATVIDVGVHHSGRGLTGDVDYEAIRRRAAAVSPVPGGVGPMMVSALLENTVAAAAGDAAFTGPAQPARRSA
jgi:methylenetetrahydrofolate dehydrogenase (NADP+) / methenyltetrahydrofolate cyclohydrolase